MPARPTKRRRIEPACRCRPLWEGSPGNPERGRGATLINAEALHPQGREKRRTSRPQKPHPSLSIESAPRHPEAQGGFLQLESNRATRCPTHHLPGPGARRPLMRAPPKIEGARRRWTSVCLPDVRAGPVLPPASIDPIVSLTQPLSAPTVTWPCWNATSAGATPPDPSRAGSPTPGTKTPRSTSRAYWSIARRAPKPCSTADPRPPQSTSASGNHRRATRTLRGLKSPRPTIPFRRVTDSRLAR
jgi:hypothetical protein